MIDSLSTVTHARTGFSTYLLYSEKRWWFRGGGGDVVNTGILSQDKHMVSCVSMETTETKNKFLAVGRREVHEQKVAQFRPRARNLMDMGHVSCPN